MIWISIHVTDSLKLVGVILNADLDYVAKIESKAL